MGKHKSSLQTHHLYLGAGGVIAVAALVAALTFGLSGAQDYQQPTTCPQGETGTPPNCSGATGGTYTPPPSVYCPNGSVAPNNDMNQCPKCPDGSYTPASGTCPSTAPAQPAGGCQSGQYWDGNACVNSTMPAAGCGTGMYWNGTSCVSNTSGTTTGTQGTQCPSGQMNVYYNHGSNQQCTNYEALPECAAGVSTYDSSTLCKNVTQQPSTGCGAGMYWSGSSCVSNTSTQQPATTCTSGQYWNGTACVTSTTQQNMYPCPALNNQMATPEQCGAATPECAPGTYPSMMNQCRSSANQQGTQPYAGQTSPTGQPNQQYFDYFSGEHSPPEGKPFNPCEFNPNDPFCKGGFDFTQLQQDFKFDESQFDFNKFNVRNSKQEIKNLKREATGWQQDAKQARRQLKETSRESSGFACPAAVEVEALVTELENAFNTVKSLNDNSTEEEIQRALAMRDHINGSYNQETGEQVPGVRSQLYGGPMDPETGEPVPGKMQSLNVCREMSGLIAGACQASKFVRQEYEDMKEAGVPADALKAFEEVLPELEARCNDPLSVLAKQGVTLADLSEPWYPDPEICEFTPFGPGFGPGPFGPGGPFPGQGGPGFGSPPNFGPGGGPGFGGGPEFGGGFPGDFGMDFDPALMEKFQQKFQEFQGGGFPSGAFFENSVLTAQSPFGDEFGDEEGFGPRGGFMISNDVAPECKPPVQRYLGFDELMRNLEEARFEITDHFESLNACDMFEKGLIFMSKEQKRGPGFGGPPPGARQLLERGVEACKDGDTDLVDQIKEKMFALFGRGGRGGDFGDFVDVDELVNEKLNKKLEKLGLGDDDKLAALEEKLAQLTAKLSEAEKTIFALKENLADMAARLASAIELSDDASTAMGNFASHPNESIQGVVASALEDLAVQAEAVKDVVPASVDALVDDVINALIESPPSSNVTDDIQESLQVIVSYAQSGATNAEIVEKAQDELATIAALNATDVASKVSEGIVAYSDTANLSEWYAMPALQAKAEGLASADLTSINPAGAETMAAAMVRACRLAGIEFEEVKLAEDAGDVDLMKELPGLPFWARGCVAELQEAGEAIAFNPPISMGSTIDRGTVAELFTQILDLPVPPAGEFGEILTPDVPVSSADAPFIAAMIETGCMQSVDGTNFGADDDFNRAQNMLVSTCLSNYQASQEE